MRDPSNAVHFDLSGSSGGDRHRLGWPGLDGFHDTARGSARASSRPSSPFTTSVPSPLLQTTVSSPAGLTDWSRSGSRDDPQIPLGQMEWDDLAEFDAFLTTLADELEERARAAEAAGRWLAAQRSRITDSKAGAHADALINQLRIVGHEVRGAELALSGFSGPSAPFTLAHTTLSPDKRAPNDPTA
jgi:hypothetical protein